jgi:hypothetical protein
MTLVKEGDQIGGTLTGPAGSTKIIRGTIKGNDFQFITTLQIGPDQMEATVAGTIEGSSIRGTISLAALGSFEFTGIKKYR